MTFREMRERFDSYGAFNNYVTVNHAKSVGRIPTDFHDYFEDYCECGSERIISVNLRMMQCTDPRCPIKQALALSNLFSNFECKGVGEAVCKQAYNEIIRIDTRRRSNDEEPLLKTNSYIEFLLLDRNEYPVTFASSSAGDLFIRFASFIKQKTLTFPEMISKLGLPELETSAIKLFEGINSFDDLANAIKSAGGVGAYCESRGFHDAMKKYWLKVSLEDIYVASVIFASSIRNEGLKDEQICITGSIYPNGSRMTKKAFIEYCNMHALTKPVTEMLVESLDKVPCDILSDKMLDYLKQRFTLDDSLLEVNISKKDFIEKIKGIESLQYPIQLFEIRMSTAKMSAVHIIADAPSQTDKYKTGLARGTEYDASGNPVKVLISSDEYLEEIERRKQEWMTCYMEEITKNLISLMDSTSTSMKTMDLGL